MQEIGEGPPVVFIHGAAVAGSSWVLLADALRDEFRCILVDRPGCGLSDSIPNGPLRSPTEFKRFADEFTPLLLEGLELDAVATPPRDLGAPAGPVDVRRDRRRTRRGRRGGLLAGDVIGAGSRISSRPRPNRRHHCAQPNHERRENLHTRSKFSGSRIVRIDVTGEQARSDRGDRHDRTP